MQILNPEDISSWWQNFNEEVIKPLETPEEVSRIVKMAFYAGAFAMYSVHISIAETTDNEEAAANKIQFNFEEIDQYFSGVENHLRGFNR